MNNQPWYSILFKVFVGIAIVGLGLFVRDTLKGMKKGAPRKDIPERIKEVQTVTVRNASLSSKLTVQGRLQAYNKITLFTEIGGSVLETGRPFQVGTYFKEGQVMLRIDATEARLNLQSQKASLLNAIANMMPDLKIDYPESFAAWNNYLLSFDVNAPIPEFPEAANQREKLFVASKNLLTQFYSIKSIEDRLSRYTLYAPFSGVLTSADINQGAVIRPGQQLGELMATGYYEMVASVPLSELKFLKPGGTVQLRSEDIQGTWEGKVSRVSDQIDAGSQTVNVFIGVRGKDLREGMYLRGEADARTFENVVQIDRNKLIDEQDVYIVVQDTLLKRVPVEIKKFDRQTVLVSGLPDGARLLDSNVAGAYDGMRVKTSSEQSESSTAAQPAAAKTPVSK